MSNKNKGITFTLVLAGCLVYFFFSGILSNPSLFYFSNKGDGFKSYYSAMYHFKYDDSALRFKGMNYPYGESVFFTDSQPLFVNFFKFINNRLFFVNDAFPASFNLLMIFSIVLASIFLFLLFFELKLPWWYSAFIAVGTTMLSPQFARFGGHFSLAAIFWLPLMIYLIVRFDAKSKIIISLLMGITAFLAGSVHLYYIVFYGFIILFYWVHRFWKIKSSGNKWSREIIQLCFQFILPVVLLQLMIWLSDSVSDRTQFPYGFVEYRSHPAAVFLPSGKPYLFVPRVVTVFRHIPWESLAFIGVAAFAGFLAGIFFFFKKLFTGKNFGRVIGFDALNVVFWASVAGLLFSFGIPFIFHLEWLADYLGILRQFRALGRFSWLFFYMINILVFYWIYQLSFIKKGYSFSWAIGILALIILFWDGAWNMKNNTNELDNRFPELEDYMNQSEQNSWVNKINPEEFQAIIPLPYFHVGSENIWIEPRQGIAEKTMIVSLKTGLPMTAVMMGRTSISQTYKNYRLVSEPLNGYDILNDFGSEKDFLIVTPVNYSPDEDEKRLIDNSTELCRGYGLLFKRLSISVLRDIPTRYSNEIIQKYHSSVLHGHGNLKVTDSTAFMILRNYDQSPSGITYAGPGAFHYPSRQWQILSEDTLLNIPAGKKFTASFWMYDFARDGYLLHNLEFTQTDPETKKTIDYFYSDVHRHIRALDGDWALIEFSFETKKDNVITKLSVRNKVLPKADFIVDELLIRESGTDIYYKTDNKLYFNTRTLE